MKRVRASDYPALRRVFAGYLHEDFLEEHETAAEALRAFLGDANQAERTRFRKEVRRLLAEVTDLEFAEVLTLLDRLGSRWRPESREDVAKVLSEIAQTDDSDPSGF